MYGFYILDSRTPCDAAIIPCFLFTDHTMRLSCGNARTETPNQSVRDRQTKTPLTHPIVHVHIFLDLVMY